MKQLRIEDYIQAHNDNEIEIHQIKSEFGPMMTGISHKGRLTFYPKTFKIEYIDENGNSQSIVDLDDISAFDYQTMNYKNPNNGNDDNSGDGSDDDNENRDDDSNFDPWNNRNDLDKLKIISDGYIDDQGRLHPAILDNGYLVYDISRYGIIDMKPATPDHVYKMTDSFDTYFGGDGYYEMNRDSEIERKLYIPSVGVYDMHIAVGSKSDVSRNIGMYVEAMEFKVSSKAGYKNQWSMVDPDLTYDGGKDDTLSKYGEDDHFHMDSDTYDTRFQLHTGNSNQIDLDLIVMRRLDDPVLPETPDIKEAVDGKEFHDVTAYDMTQGKLYDGDGSYSIESLTDTDNKLHYYTDKLVQVGNSVYQIGIDVPEESDYYLSILAKYANTNLDGRYKISINGIEYTGLIYSKPVNNQPYYEIPLLKFTSGSSNTYEPAGKIHLTKGLNKIKISYKGDIESKNFDELPLLNSILISGSDKYYTRSLDDMNRLVYSNFDNIYYGLNDADMDITDGRKFVRSGFNYTQSYDLIDKYGFSYNAENIQLNNPTDILDSRLKYDLVMKKGEDVTKVTEITEFRPKLVVLGSLDKDENNKFNGYMNINFYVLDASQTQNKLWESPLALPTRPADVSDWKDTTDLAGRKLIPVQKIPEIKISLGEDWQGLFLEHSNGVSMSDTLYLTQLFEK